MNRKRKKPTAGEEAAQPDKRRRRDSSTETIMYELKRLLEFKITKTLEFLVECQGYDGDSVWVPIDCFIGGARDEAEAFAARRGWVEAKTSEASPSARKVLKNLATKYSHGTCSCNDGCRQSCPNRQVSYECGSTNCSASNCSNRYLCNFQPRADDFTVRWTGVERGFGLFSNKTFDAGELIMEFVGKILTNREADNAPGRSKSYQMSLGDGLVLDMAELGSVARFSNSSCQPNCVVKQTIVDGQPRMGLYVGSDTINAGMELTFDYNFKPDGQAAPCFCGKLECRRLLGRIPTDFFRVMQRAIIVVGAGISVSAGIPTFRSKGGIFLEYDKDTFDATRQDSPSFCQMVRELAVLSKKAQPTRFHHLLASLASEGRLLRLYTQNIDCIDTGMASLATMVPLDPEKPPQTVALHGSLEHMYCETCQHRTDLDANQFQGSQRPVCTNCQKVQDHRSTKGLRLRSKGRFRPGIVLYNESHPEEEAIGKIITADLAACPDAIIVVGTRLDVTAAKRMVKDFCKVVQKKGGKRVWINLEQPPRDTEWDIVLLEESDAVASQVAPARN